MGLFFVGHWETDPFPPLFSSRLGSLTIGSFYHVFFTLFSTPIYLVDSQMEDLTNTWSKLNLSECEGSNVRLMETQATIEWGLATKFFTRRALNLDAIAKTFSPLWRASKGFKVRIEGDHMVLFTFEVKTEMMRVLAGEPWTFDKHLMVLQEYDGTKEVRDMNFELATFWVQVHDLPPRFRNRRVVEHLCEAIGTVKLGEENPAMEGDRFVRVRATVNISKPLCRGRVITLDDG